MQNGGVIRKSATRHKLLRVKCHKVLTKVALLRFRGRLWPQMGLVWSHSQNLLAGKTTYLLDSTCVWKRNLSYMWLGLAFSTTLGAVLQYSWCEFKVLLSRKQHSPLVFMQASHHCQPWSASLIHGSCEWSYLSAKRSERRYLWCL